MIVSEILGMDSQPSNSLKVELAEGERLGNFTGPVEIYVPKTPGNTEFDDLERAKAEMPLRAQAEMERRVALGHTAQTSTGKSVPLQMQTEADFRNLNGLVSAAQIKTGQGDTSPFFYRGASNTSTELTPAEMIEVGLQALAHVDAHYQALWAIMDADPPPLNVSDDALWPPASAA